MQQRALRGRRRVDEAKRAQRLRKSAMRLGIGERRMQHEIADALACDAEILGERPREHGVLVQR